MLYGFLNTFIISLIIIDDVASHMEYSPYSVCSKAEWNISNVVADSFQELSNIT